MSDNVLKKDFNKKDVERLRNLVKGKAGERTTQGIGYTKKEEFHKEGDICCLLYTSPSPRDRTRSRMPSSA